MSLSSSHDGRFKFDTCIKRKIEERVKDDMHPCKKTCKTLSIVDLPDECLSRVYESLQESSTDCTSFSLCLQESSTDCASFSLVCHRWLYIHLQNLICLSLSNWCPEIADSVASKSQFFGLQILFQCSNPCFEYSDHMMFSWFPHLATVRLVDTRITDKGLKVLAKCCPALEKIDLTKSQGITDSGISFLIQNYSKLSSLTIKFCKTITGIGFLGCPKTLKHVDAVGACGLTTEGIKAIASGGGLQNLHLSGNAVNNEAVITISKSCPSLTTLHLKSCPKVQLEGWKAIGMYCKNLKFLRVVDHPMLRDIELQALCDGCNKLSFLVTDRWNAASALKLFRQERPSVCICKSDGNNYVKPLNLC